MLVHLYCCSHQVMWLCSIVWSYILVLLLVLRSSVVFIELCCYYVSIICSVMLVMLVGDVFVFHIVILHSCVTFSDVLKWFFYGIVLVFVFVLFLLLCYWCVCVPYCDPTFRCYFQCYAQVLCLWNYIGVVLVLVVVFCWCCHQVLCLCSILYCISYPKVLFCFFGFVDFDVYDLNFVTNIMLFGFNFWNYFLVVSFPNIFRNLFGIIFWICWLCD